MPVLTNGEIVRGAPSLGIEQKKQISDYIRARRVAAEALAIVDKLKAPVMLSVDAAGGTVSMMNSIVQIGESVSYEYPPMVARQEDKLRQTKKIMQLDGRAQKMVRPCLQFFDQRAA